MAPQNVSQNLVARQITRRFVLGIARFETLANSVCPNELNGARHVLLLQLLYGQHSIYRRDTGTGPQAVATKPEAVSEPETLAKTTPAQSDKGESAGAKELSIAA